MTFAWSRTQNKGQDLDGRHRSWCFSVRLGPHLLVAEREELLALLPAALEEGHGQAGHLELDGAPAEDGALFGEPPQSRPTFQPVSPAAASAASRETCRGRGTLQVLHLP